MEANRFGLKLSLITLETATRPQTQVASNAKQRHPATSGSRPTRNKRTLQLAGRVQRETNASCNLQIASNPKQPHSATCKSRPTRNKRTLQLADRVQRETNAPCKPASRRRFSIDRMVFSPVLCPIPPKHRLDCCA